MKYLVILAALLSQASHARPVKCALTGLTISELRDSRKFSVSAEQPTKISDQLFWANYDFFQDYSSKRCKGAFVSALVMDRKASLRYRYYRTVEDRCDGGNTHGIIVKVGRYDRFATISDGDISCD